jgi:hypothetical protein
VSILRCHWCGNEAQHRVKARGGDGGRMEIVYCDPEAPCWDKTFKVAKNHPYQDWTPIEQAKRGHPDLFDLLPDEGKTA